MHELLMHYSKGLIPRHPVLSDKHTEVYHKQILPGRMPEQFNTGLGQNADSETASDHDELNYCTISSMFYINHLKR